MFVRPLYFKLNYNGIQKNFITPKYKLINHTKKCKIVNFKIFVHFFRQIFWLSNKNSHSKMNLQMGK